MTVWEFLAIYFVCCGVCLALAVYLLEKDYQKYHGTEAGDDVQGEYRDTLPKNPAEYGLLSDSAESTKRVARLLPVQPRKARSPRAKKPRGKAVKAPRI